MSRKFMVLMLIVFGTLLYLTSYALRQHTAKEEEPKPTAEQQAEMKKMQEEEMRDRVASEKLKRKAAEADMAAAKIESSQTPAPTKTPKLQNRPSLDMPGAMRISEEQKQKRRGPTDVIITSDWYRARKSGQAGVEEEIKLREKNAKLHPKPMPPGAPSAPQQSSAQGKGAGGAGAHGPGDGHGH